MSVPPDTIILSCNQLAIECIEFKNYAEARRLLKKAYAYAMNQDLQASSKLKGMTLNNMGCLYKRQNKYSGALSYFTRALKEDCEDLTSVGGIYLNLCSIYSAMNQHREALGSALNAVSTLRSLPDESPVAYSIALAYFNAANEYDILNEKDSARQAYEDAHSYALRSVGPEHRLTKSVEEMLKEFSYKRRLPGIRPNVQRKAPVPDLYTFYGRRKPLLQPIKRQLNVDVTPWRNSSNHDTHRRPPWRPPGISNRNLSLDLSSSRLGDRQRGSKSSLRSGETTPDKFKLSYANMRKDSSAQGSYSSDRDHKKSTFLLRKEIELLDIKDPFSRDPRDPREALSNRQMSTNQLKKNDSIKEEIVKSDDSAKDDPSEQSIQEEIAGERSGNMNESIPESIKHEHSIENGRDKKLDDSVKEDNISISIKNEGSVKDQDLKNEKSIGKDEPIEESIKSDSNPGFNSKPPSSNFVRKKVRTNSKKQEVNAAIKIQKNYRNFVRKKSFKSGIQTLEQNLPRIIQRFWLRIGIAALKATPKKLIDCGSQTNLVQPIKNTDYKVLAAIKIQAHLRGFMCRLLYKQVKDAAILIQRTNRMWKVRRIFLDIRAAVTFIQACYRGYSVRKRLRLMNKLKFK